MILLAAVAGLPLSFFAVPWAAKSYNPLVTANQLAISANQIAVVRLCQENELFTFRLELFLVLKR